MHQRMYVFFFQTILLTMLAYSAQADSQLYRGYSRIIIDSKGDYYVLNTRDNSILHIDRIGGQRTLLVQDDPSLPFAHRLHSPIDMDLDSDGGLYVLNYDRFDSSRSIQRYKIAASGPERGQGRKSVERELVSLDIDSRPFFREFFREPHFLRIVNEKDLLLHTSGIGEFSFLSALTRFAFPDYEQENLSSVNHYPDILNNDVFSAMNRGKGPLWDWPTELLVEPEGTILMLCSHWTSTTGNGMDLELILSTQAILRVDPSSGDRTVISGTAIGEPSHVVKQLKDWEIIDTPEDEEKWSRLLAEKEEARAQVGEGPALQIPRGGAIGKDGFLYVVNLDQQQSYSSKKGFYWEYKGWSIARVDRATGDRTIVSSPTVGSGFMLEYPFDIAVQEDGILVVVDAALNEMVRVDPITGSRTLFASPSSVCDWDTLH